MCACSPCPTPSLTSATDYSFAELRAAGCSASSLRDAGCTAANLRAVAFPLPDLIAAGYGACDLLQAAYAPLHLRQEQVALPDILAALPQALYLHYAGYCYRCVRARCVPSCLRVATHMTSPGASGRYKTAGHPSAGLSATRGTSAVHQGARSLTHGRRCPRGLRWHLMGWTPVMCAECTRGRLRRWSWQMETPFGLAIGGGIPPQKQVRQCNAGLLALNHEPKQNAAFACG